MVVLAAVAVATSHATEDFVLTRGADRYATAAALDALAASESVVVARGDAFPGALAGTRRPWCAAHRGR